ncbi:unnamed protein product [Oncorhynchus mykiss]|uniref:TMEM87A/B GOLD domain-containing protein n=1 Tax=Oncorhynchus mykiss TaxID=8022 RepID=A0A060WEA1_ONCMY|nr:unnamed protein product [Oncorhynchus mykiss]
MSTVPGLTEHCDPPVKLNISWYLRSSRCFDEVFGLDPLKAGSYFRTTAVKQEGGSGFYVFHQYPVIECKQTMTHIELSLNKFEEPTRLTEPVHEQVSGLKQDRFCITNPSIYIHILLKIRYR